MDDLGTVLLVLFSSDPLGLEGGEGREGGTTGPDGVVSVTSSDDLNHIVLWAQSIELLLKCIWETFVKGGSSGKDDIAVEIFSNINIAILDGLVAHLVHTKGLISLLDQRWIEKGLWSHESWGVDVDRLTIRKLVGLLEL